MAWMKSPRRWPTASRSPPHWPAQRSRGRRRGRSCGAHGLTDILDPALQAVGELTAVASQFTESTNYYLTLRYRFSTLRLIAYDSHPRHTSPHLATACDTRRRAALRVLACVCRACDGTWGFGKAREPGGGTRMWATLPRASLRRCTGRLEDVSHRRTLPSLGSAHTSVEPPSLRSSRWQVHRANHGEGPHGGPGERGCVAAQGGVGAAGGGNTTRRSRCRSSSPHHTTCRPSVPWVRSSARRTT
ncbi:hypothetical protein SVIOM342S_06658 [Streptomyces violaceorubidus]